MKKHLPGLLACCFCWCLCGCGVETAATAVTIGTLKAQEAKNAQETQARVEEQLKRASQQAQTRQESADQAAE